MAGDRSGAGNHLLADFILVGQRLRQLGFIYHKGIVRPVNDFDICHNLT